MRLIDAEKAIATIDEVGRTLIYSNYHDKAIRNDMVVFAIDMLKAMPTIDAVPVVRCGECKHFCQYAQRFAPRVENADGDCYIRLVYSEAHPQFSAVRKNDYCSMGAKMDAKEDEDAT